SYRQWRRQTGQTAQASAPRSARYPISLISTAGPVGPSPHNSINRAAEGNFAESATAFYGCLCRATANARNSLRQSAADLPGKIRTWVLLLSRFRIAAHLGKHLFARDAAKRAAA
ncbi:hypothetical protein, partial [Pseudoalteromonas sp. S558]|uniref:hypothetical protein n=1 Tax=Pseudoalteromonas sp. S558 TaxID=2066515 RepID=UPI001BB10683